jgi:hypothetical protein
MAEAPPTTVTETASSVSTTTLVEFVPRATTLTTTPAWCQFEGDPRLESTTTVTEKVPTTVTATETETATETASCEADPPLTLTSTATVTKAPKPTGLPDTGNQTDFAPLLMAVPVVAAIAVARRRRRGQPAVQAKHAA